MFNLIDKIEDKLIIFAVLELPHQTLENDSLLLNVSHDLGDLLVLHNALRLRVDPELICNVLHFLHLVEYFVQLGNQVLRRDYLILPFVQFLVLVVGPQNPFGLMGEINDGHADLGLRNLLLIRELLIHFDFVVEFFVLVVHVFNVPDDLVDLRVHLHQVVPLLLNNVLLPNDVLFPLTLYLLQLLPDFALAI